MSDKAKNLTLFCALLSALTGCAGADLEDGARADDDQDQDVAESAQALGSGCFGTGCDNRDPSLCEPDAYTVASSQIWTAGGVATGTVAIRFSPSCNAAWTRVSTSSGTAFLRAELTRTTANGTTNSQAASPSPTSAQRSLMLGVTSGAGFAAIGRIGPSYGYYPYAGNVAHNF
jgi:hypothetical protein